MEFSVLYSKNLRLFLLGKKKETGTNSVLEVLYLHLLSIFPYEGLIFLSGRFYT